MANPGATYTLWRSRAIARGWVVPPPHSPIATWWDAWVNYWRAMHDYEVEIANGETDPGRPVPPHRSATFHG